MEKKLNCNHNSGKRLLYVVIGPTAVGKSDYAVSLAKKIGSPIISCDSRQIYKELRVGTAPPSAEQLKEVQHYFIFSHSIHNHYTAGKYEIEALQLLDLLFLSYDRLVMVGGSGLYIDAVLYGIDPFPPADMLLRNALMKRLENEGLAALSQELKDLDRESYESIDLANPQRVIRAIEVTMATGQKFSSYKSNCSKKRDFDVEFIKLELPRDELYERINRRVDSMVCNGLIEEAESLYQYRHLPSLKTVGYREIFDYIDGRHSLDSAIELIKRNSRRYAKRQITWFNKY